MTAETSQQLARRLHLIQLIRCLNLPCQAEKGDAGIKCFNKAVPVSMYALNICVYKIYTWIWMCDMSINKYTYVNTFVHTWLHVIYLQSFWCRNLPYPQPKTYLQKRSSIFFGWSPPSMSVFVVLEVASVPSCHTTRKKLADFSTGRFGKLWQFWLVGDSLGLLGYSPENQHD